MTAIPFYPSFQNPRFLSPNKQEMMVFYPNVKINTPIDSYCDNSTDDENISGSFDSEENQMEKNENEVLTILNNRRQKTIIDETKFKTEMCKNWQTKGFCNYEAKCKFAHGPHELNKKEFVHKTLYKSKPCISFHTKHFCPYGLRCLFIHQDRALKAIVEKNFYTKKLNTMIFSTETEKKNEKRLKFFSQNVTKSNKSENMMNLKSFECESKKLFHDDLWKMNEITNDGKTAGIHYEKEIEEMVKFII